MSKSSVYTAIISDLHLCEAEPVHPRYPLWKKFKTKEFFFDDVFQKFLLSIQQEARGSKLELILNGDIFDSDSVTALPDKPPYKVSWLEKNRGLNPRPEKSLFKIKKIIEDHPLWFEALREFIYHGHEVVFIIGNHDLEMHYPDVQNAVLEALQINETLASSVRFTEWFYISQNDTLVEHGNQYDPYCVCEDPINPFTYGYNYKTMRLPFGNLACRYITNGMGFFNPHVDSNYIMTLSQYVRFFVKYIIRAQPLLMVTWFWGSLVTLYVSFLDNLATQAKNPLRVEDRVEEIARKAKAEPRMVRELKELFVNPARQSPILLARELWLDRAFLIILVFIFAFLIISMIQKVFNISFFWMFIPLFLLIPFFIFYSKSIISNVSKYKEPDEKILTMASAITGVNRIVFGHTHQVRHEIIGPVEHLNSGCWSPAFLDVECTKPIDQKTFVWIYPSDSSGIRVASVKKFDEMMIKDMNIVRSKIKN